MFLKGALFRRRNCGGLSLLFIYLEIRASSWEDQGRGGFIMILGQNAEV